MPSPFPGMDPYLESPAVWPNLHLLLIAALNSQLKPLLRPRGYLVSIGERVWVTEPGRAVYPDVAIIERPPQSRATPSAVIEADAPIKVHVNEVEVHEPYLEIVDSTGGRLVTGIEVLSPINKAPGHGRSLYLRKQRETLAAGANLVEIDLLRRGRHALAVPAHLLDELPNWDYLISVARVTVADEFEVYPVPLTARLPRFRIPLKPGDEDVVCDLQAVMNHAYDEGPFADRVDYSHPPKTKLSKEKAAWCEQLLAKHHPRS